MGRAGLLARGQLHPDMVNEWWTRGRFLVRSGVQLTAKARDWRIHSENGAQHCGNFVTKYAAKCGSNRGLRVWYAYEYEGGK